MSHSCNDLTTFKEWLETFLEEKNLSLEETTIECVLTRLDKGVGDKFFIT